MDKFVYIGIPSRTKGFWDTYIGLLTACTRAAQKGIYCTVDPHVGSSLICRARQNITWKFLFENPKCTHFLQLDDDVVLPPDGIIDLVEANKDVIGGMYSLKSRARKVAIRALKDGVFKIKDLGNDPVEIKYLSGGCILQTREIVQSAWDNYLVNGRRYLDNGEGTEGDRERVALYTPFIYKEEYLSEDWAYCQRLRDMGVKIWLHPKVKCVHWGLAPYGVE